ncbi:MAG: hypothetical protein ACMZI0_03295 [Symbiopectobacterium sp.]|uniref:hypothetical protein n=1 Tax=Symbiopectobacterium sp. TaxID=2952789 RepID=UPI0039EC278F
MKPYHLPHQLETTPIGGKVVSQRWRDNASNKALLKVEYVYQSTEQLASLAPLNRANPPQRVTLTLRERPTNDKGFCPFEDFEKITKALAQ